MPKQYTKDNPRFVWNIGAISELFPDMRDVAQGPQIVLWDRQERKPVVTLEPGYTQLFCLETTTHGQPLTDLEAWLNQLSNSDLKSENVTPTR